jgi:hypothetical protein
MSAHSLLRSRSPEVGFEQPFAMLQACHKRHLLLEDGFAAARERMQGAEIEAMGRERQQRRAGA